MARARRPTARRVGVGRGQAVLHSQSYDRNPACGGSCWLARAATGGNLLRSGGLKLCALTHHFFASSGPGQVRMSLLEVRLGGLYCRLAVGGAHEEAAYGAGQGPARLAATRDALGAPGRPGRGALLLLKEVLEILVLLRAELVVAVEVDPLLRRRMRPDGVVLVELGDVSARCDDRRRPDLLFSIRMLPDHVVLLALVLLEVVKAPLIAAPSRDEQPVFVPPEQSRPDAGAEPPALGRVLLVVEEHRQVLADHLSRGGDTEE